MHRLLIVACSATKNPAAEAIPALERYDGVAYRVIRRWQRETAQDEPFAILILSARFGLIRAETPIPNYEHPMTAGRAAELRPQVTQALQVHLATLGPYRATCISLGQDYWEALDLESVRDHLGVITRTKGGIGMQLGQLKGWLYEVQP
jgi:hypothetical protein